MAGVNLFKWGKGQGALGQEVHEEEQEWQIRIKVPHKQSVQAKDILQEKLNASGFAWKYIDPTGHEEDFNDIADGLISGSDRDEKWKTICIYLPAISAAERFMPKAQYGAKIKTLLLACWKDLQDRGIDCIYNVPLGDKAITFDGGVPTPFSITSFKPYQFPQGILYQTEHNPHNYPDPSELFSITSEDLAQAEIQADSNALFKAEQDLYAENIVSGQAFIQGELERINAIQQPLAELLSDDAVKNILAQCREQFEQCVDVESCEAAILQLNTILAPIFDRFPKTYQSGAPFDVNNIGELKQHIQRLQTLLDNKKEMVENPEEGINPDDIFDLQLTDYKRAMQEIFSDNGAASESFTALQTTLNASITIARQDFPVVSQQYDTDELWDKDPAAMQRLHFSMHHHRYTVAALERSQRQQLSLLPVVKDIFKAIDKQIGELKPHSYLRDGSAKITALKLLKDELTSFDNLNKSVADIITDWKKLQKFTYSKTNERSDVAAVLHQHRNLFRDENRKKPTGTEKVIAQIVQDHGNTRIELANNGLVNRLDN